MVWSRAVRYASPLPSFSRLAQVVGVRQAGQGPGLVSFFFVRFANQIHVGCPLYMLCDP